MNRIKDFFYDKNDIIVAVIILIAAAIVIYIRVDKIMDYPETLLNNPAAEQGQEPQAADASEPSSEDPSTLKSIQIANDPIPSTVAKQLETAGIVSSAKEFEGDLKKYKMEKRIQPGSYQIPTGMTNEQVIEVITGETI